MDAMVVVEANCTEPGANADAVIPVTLEQLSGSF